MTLQSGGTVGDFMHRNLETVLPESTIVTVAERMREKSLGSLLVESDDEGGRISGRSGIVTETDLIRRVLAKGIDPALTIVDQIVSNPLLTIAPTRPMLDASHIRHLCVSDKNDIVGIISMRDLARHFVDSEGGPVRDLDNVFRPLSVLMRTTMETIASERTVLEAARAMAEKRIGSLLV